MHTVNVTTDRVTTDGVIVLTKGSYGVELTFNFIGEEWSGLIKKAVFNGVQRTIQDNKCIVPKEVTETTGNIKLGVYGLDVDGDGMTARLSPFPSVISVIDGSFSDDLTDAENDEDVINEAVKHATAEIKAELERIKATHLDTTEITDYTGFFSGGMRSEIIGKVDTSNALKITSMYNGCYKLEEIPPMNTSKCKNFNTVFIDCSGLKTAPELDTSNGESFNSMFSGCNALETPPNYDTGKAEDLSMMFYRCGAMSGIITLDTKSCTSLTNTFAACENVNEIHFTDTSNVIQWSSTFSYCKKMHTITNVSMPYGGYNASTFSYCTELQNVTFGVVKIRDNNFTLTSSTKLTVESLLSLIDAFVDNTGGTRRTVKIGGTNLAKLTATAEGLEYIQKADSKNIELM